MIQTPKSAVVKALLNAFLGSMILVACSEGGSSDDARPVPVKEASERLEWKVGSDNTMVHFGKNSIVRCWRLQENYDCLAADEYDVRSEIADAPVRRTFFRFISRDLPTTRKVLERIAGSGGYECNVSSLVGTTTQEELIWNGGEIVERNMSASHRGEYGWPPERAVGKIAQHLPNPQRPYFVCLLANDAVENAGLPGIDLIEYEDVMAADRRLDFEAEDFNRRESGAAGLTSPVGPSGLP